MQELHFLIAYERITGKGNKLHGRVYACLNERMNSNRIRKKVVGVRLNVFCVSAFKIRQWLWELLTCDSSVGVSAISHLLLHGRTQGHGDKLTNLMKCTEPRWPS
ncbi:hypothetical protein BSK33_17080 [Geobacillus sp. 44B]|nr:hypothetical protein BSK33_17080 [Geobacillus sp. 44B]